MTSNVESNAVAIEEREFKAGDMVEIEVGEGDFIEAQVIGYTRLGRLKVIDDEGDVLIGNEWQASLII